MSDVSGDVKKDIKFQVAILFDVVVPATNHLYPPTKRLYNGSIEDNLNLFENFRSTIIAATRLDENLKKALSRPAGVNSDDAIVITIASVQ